MAGNIWFQPSGISKGRPGCWRAMSMFVPPCGEWPPRRPGPGQVATTLSLNSVRLRSSWKWRKEGWGSVPGGKVRRAA